MTTGFCGLMKLHLSLMARLIEIIVFIGVKKSSCDFRRRVKSARCCSLCKKFEWVVCRTFLLWVTSEKYLGILRDVVIPELQNNPIYEYVSLLWLQEGAPLQCGLEVRHFLHNTFDEQCLSSKVMWHDTVRCTINTQLSRSYRNTSTSFHYL